MRTLGLGLGLSQGVPVFIPWHLNSCILALESTIGITKSGTAISQWSDQSSAGNHMIQNTSANKPVFNSSNANFGGQPSVDGDGARFMKTAAKVTYSQPLTMIWVGRTTNTGTTQFMISTPFTNRCDILLDAAGPYWELYGGSQLHAGSANTSPVIVAGTFNTTGKLFVNNSQTPLVTNTVGTDSWDCGEIGALLGSTDPFIGSMVGALVFNRILTSSELKSIFRYYASKFSLSGIS